MNRIILIGRTTKEPEIRYTQGEKSMAIANFTLAVQRSYKKDGAEGADFVNCAAFGKTAEIIEKYVKKGTKLAIEGEWHSDSYTKKDGTKVYTDTCNVRSLEFCESKNANGGNGAEQTAQQAQSASNSFMDIPDDIGEDLPFM